MGLTLTIASTDFASKPTMMVTPSIFPVSRWQASIAWSCHSSSVLPATDTKHFGFSSVRGDKRLPWPALNKTTWGKALSFFQSYSYSAALRRPRFFNLRLIKNQAMACNFPKLWMLCDNCYIDLLLVIALTIIMTPLARSIESFVEKHCSCFVAA